MSTTTPPRRLLVCTIARDVFPHLNTWHRQFVDLTAHLQAKGWRVDLSVYENDSVDGTAGQLNSLGINMPDYVIRTDRLGTQRYGSIWSIDRLRNLAHARQQCIYQAVARYGWVWDKIVYIEPDVTYDPSWCSELILARHPLAAGIGEPDIYSAWSLRPLSNPKESVYLYDTCATRAGCDDICWDVNESGGTWRAGSLVPTNLGGVDGNCLHRVWSTFNCFCVYNAKPFKEGVKWGIINKRIDPSGIKVEGFYLDADTVNICEQFRERGYGGIYLNTNCLVRHN